MKTSLFIPVVGAILALSACSDSEPVQTPSTSRSEPASSTAPATASTTTVNEPPAQRGGQATIVGSAKSNAPGTAGTGSAPAGTPAVLRGDQAELAGPAKTSPPSATPAANGVPTAGGMAGNNPPVLRGEQAEVVGEARTAARSTVDAVAPAAGDKAEAGLTPARDGTSKADAQARAADDSGRNKREDGTQPTPLDQGSSDSDLKITQGIRSTVVGRDDLSTNAKNAKIITRDGVVTLRGPVANAQEAEAIASIAKAQVGVTRIDNLLEPLQQ